MANRGLRLITLAAIPVLVLSACSTAATTPAASTSVTAAPPASAEASAPVGNTTVKWFVGLGSGTQPAQIKDQKDFVAAYNKDNKDKITIKLEIIPNANAYDVLKTEFASGNAPDIIGPVGVKGRNGFEGLFLDLTPVIARNNFDLTAYPESLVKFFQQGGQGQVGLPYVIYPGYIWYNKDAFSKAGLPGLPTKVGDQYQGQTWDWAQLSKVAAQLTLDKNGKKSTDAGFDANSIVKYGMGFQWHDDLKRIVSWFQGGNFVDDAGKAQIPAVWAEAIDWYYTGIWTSHILPNSAAMGSTLLGSSNLQGSGNLAMNAAFGWSISSIASTAADSKVKLWDMGVAPSYKGATTAPMDADTFTIAKSSKNPDAAFKAMVAIMASPILTKTYGGQPAKTADQAAYFTSFDATLAPIFPGIKVTWSVLGEMAKYPSVPSHEANMPAYLTTNATANAFKTKLETTKGLVLADELAKLKTTLQTQFDAAQPLLNE